MLQYYALIAHFKHHKYTTFYQFATCHLQDYLFCKTIDKKSISNMTFQKVKYHAVILMLSYKHRNIIISVLVKSDKLIKC